MGRKLMQAVALARGAGLLDESLASEAERPPGSARRRKGSADGETMKLMPTRQLRIPDDMALEFSRWQGWMSQLGVRRSSAMACERSWESPPLNDLESQLTQIRNSAAGEIGTFAIAIIRESDVVGKSQLLGSGTLVQIGTTKGIMTAQHIARNIRPDSSIGIAILKTEHRISVSGGDLNRIDIGVPVREGAGPDISFLNLPESIVNTISASRSFFNLSTSESRFRSALFHDPEGIYAISGVADLDVTREGPTHHFKEVLDLSGAVGFTFACKQFEQGDFDYLDLSVRYGEDTEPPRDFQGYSGGGVWVIPIQNRQGNLSPEKVLLWGIAFSQSAVEDSRRVIQCHGPRSLYERALPYLRERFEGAG
jgi:hypothetical protein